MALVMANIATQIVMSFMTTGLNPNFKLINGSKFSLFN
jgi:hypothetical protein